MQIELNISEDMSPINTIDGKPVDFKTELKTRISFFQSNQSFINRKTAGIFLRSDSSNVKIDITEQMFFEILENSGSDWSTLKFTGATNKAGLPEVTRLFRLKTLADASFYSGIIKEKMLRFFLTLLVTTLLALFTIYALTFIPLMKRWITFTFAHLWLFATTISVYIIFIGCKTSSIINCRKKSTLQAFNNAITTKNPEVIGKLHQFYSNHILGNIERPLAVFVKDFGALDTFSKDVLFKVLENSEDERYTGGLLVCICGEFHCELFERLNNDQIFKKSALGGKYTVLEIS